MDDHMSRRDTIALILAAVATAAAGGLHILRHRRVRVPVRYGPRSLDVTASAWSSDAADAMDVAVSIASARVPGLIADDGLPVRVRLATTAELTDPDHGAETHRVYHADGRILRCEVLVRYDVLRARPWVLLHELLHCAGYDHPRWAPTGHALHPVLARGGWDTRGITITQEDRT